MEGLDKYLNGDNTDNLRDYTVRDEEDTLLSKKALLNEIEAIQEGLEDEDVSSHIFWFKFKEFIGKFEK